MNKWLILTTGMAFLMTIQMLRADEPTGVPRVCPEGRAVFGKLSCTDGSSAGEPLFEAYFYGATSLPEIRASFPDRVAKIDERCRKKSAASRSPASVGGTRAIEFKVMSVDACLGKRGFQQPCEKDDDCLERFCHPERGMCSKVFTFPIFAAP